MIQGNRVFGFCLWAKVVRLSRVYTGGLSGYTVHRKRFQPKQIFTSKEEAEAYGLRLAEQ